MAGRGKVARTDRQLVKAVTVNRGRAEVYQAWERFRSRMSSGNGSSDVAPGRSETAGATRPNESAPWESPGGHGVVQFRDAPAGRGTEVRVNLSYDAPAGRVENTAWRLVGGHPEDRTREDLRQFKQLAETGEIPTTESQPSGRQGFAP
ncbi:MAG: cyclase [Dehalococcoidia bacterium]|nr:cyclase [Dehalococcoidia bacterium]